MSFEEDYHPYWFAVMSHVLGWSDEQMEVFVDYHRKVREVHGPYCMTHDNPLDFVVPYCIPQDMWAALGFPKGSDIRFQISLIVGPETSEFFANDWSDVKLQIQALLNNYGYSLPSPNDSFEFWKERKGFGIGFSRTPF